MQVYKRGDRWWVYERKDGKTVRRSLGPDVRTKEQALSVAAGNPLVPDLTLDALFKGFLVDAKIRMSPSSADRYKFSFRVFMRYVDGFTLAADLTSRHINQWAATQLDRGRSPEGINLDLRHIRAALRRAEESGDLAFAPKIDMVRTSKRLPRHLSPDQFKLISAAESDPVYSRLWSFFVWTGLRRNEALNLNWYDVSFGESPTMRVIGKGDRERVVPLLPPALEAMGPYKPSGRVFAVAGDRQVTHRFKMAARKAGVPWARLHDLRHTCLTWLVGHEVPLKLVQDIAGHSSINTTMRYAKIFTGNAHDVLNKAFGF